MKQRCPKSLLTYCFIIGFGIGSWIAINGIWAEISVLVVVCPECYNLPALIVIIIQMANVGPLLYTMVKYFIHRSKWESYQQHLDIGVIICLIAIGILSSTLLSIFWDRNIAIFGDVHSVALLVLTFFLALVDCTSSVVFIPFMKNFPEEYLSALYIGEGMSGVLPTFASLIQGSVRDNISCNGTYTGHKELGVRFSPNVYFTFLTTMMIVCGISFFCIISLPSVRKHMVNRRKQTGYNNEVQNRINKTVVYVGSDSDLANDEDNQLRQDEDDTLHQDDKIGRCSLLDKQKHSSSPRKSSRIQSNRDNAVDITSEGLHSQRTSFSCISVMEIIYSNAVLYFCLGILSFLSNGALSAISSFAFIPYGDFVYHIAIDLALLATPLTSAFFHLFPSKSKVITVMNTAITCILGIYILDMAIMNPTPLLRTQLIGKILIVSFLVFKIL